MSKLITSKIEYKHKYLMPVLTEQFGEPCILKADASKEQIQAALDKHKIVQCETANGFTFHGRWHKQKKRATIIIQDEHKRQIAFRTIKHNTYKAIVEDYDRRGNTWNNLGVNYVKSTLKTTRSRHRLRIVKDKRENKKHVIALSR